MSDADGIRVDFRGRLGTQGFDVRFTVPIRGVTGLIGPSGSGKTTVLRCIAGLQRLQGTCVVGGEVWQDGAAFRPTHRRPIGYVFQEPSLFPHLSVQRNLTFGMRGAPPRPGTGVGFDEVVALCGLAALLGRSPRHLSGGERQRVAIGRALLSNPRLLLMDEPLSALDQASRDEILPFLKRLHDSLLVPVIYVSHDMREIGQFADHLVLMAEGRVRAAGPLGDLQGDPALPLAAARDAAVDLHAVIDGNDIPYGLVTLRSGGARFIVPGPPGPVGEARRLRIAAGDVSLARTALEGSTILNVLPVKILTATPVGNHEVLAVLGLEPGDPDAEGPRLLARVTRRSWDQLGFEVGDHVYAQMKSVALTPSLAPSSRR